MAHAIKGSGMMNRAIVKKDASLNSQLKQSAGDNSLDKQDSKPTIEPTEQSTLIPGVSVGSQKTPGILTLNVKTEATNNLANTKEKTPMCLVNELARYNKVQHQYTLTDEQGPAHKKTFYVKLKLSDEEYAESGPSIKKAQHAAAAQALLKTSLSKPPAKATRVPAAHKTAAKQSPELNKSVTPTVELNALVMKRNEVATYESVDVPPTANPSPPIMRPINVQQRFYPPPQHVYYAPRPNYGGRPLFPRSFKVKLKVGEREFEGEGTTRQAARHNAATRALQELRNLPLPEKAATAEAAGDDVTEEEVCNGDVSKSEISQVHEIALKRGLKVDFDVVRESGPPHLKTFLTRCVCGNIEVEGEDASKKLSKKRAAEKMLLRLKALPALPPTLQTKVKRPQAKKKAKNIVKMQKAAPDYGSQINPISRLIQIQQAKKGKDPIYLFIGERGLSRRREFVIQVEVGDVRCQGIGPNKKLAKRSAAEQMLQALGYSRPSPQPAKSAIKGAADHVTSPTDKKVHFSEEVQTSKDKQQPHHQQQLIPGVILMPPEKMKLEPIGYAVQGAMIRPGYPGVVGNHSPHTIATVARELLETRQSATAEAIRTRSAPGTLMRPIQRPEEMLYYMGEVLCFAVQFTDFPKGVRGELMSLVTLSTVPPQVSHGAGATRDAAHEMAAHQALKALAAATDVDHRGDAKKAEL